MMVLLLLKGMFLTALSTIIGAFGALFLKKTSNGIRDNFIGIFKEKKIYFGFLLYGISALIFVYALRFGDLSSLYPIAGLSYVWIAILSSRYLKEKMNNYKLLGMLMIIIGIIFIGLGS